MIPIGSAISIPTTYDRPTTHNVCGIRSAMMSTTGLRVA